MIRVLIVDDDRSLCELLDARLSRRGCVATCRTSASEAFELLEHKQFDVLVTDLNMSEMNGLELCERVVQNRPEIPVVVMTAHGSLDTAIEAIRVGAFDFVTKPFEIDDLRLALERAVNHRQLKEEVKRLRSRLPESQPFPFVEGLGTSPAMKIVFEFLKKVVHLDSSSVLLAGESGTGKGVIARALHDHGPRKDRPFVAVNCAAVPEPLLESELFGHAKGSFTDAKTDRRGLFQQAHTGTLFLDEIGELPLQLQPKLLRALQERTVRPVGSDTEIPFDVRIIAATNRDLQAAVADKTFREDLFYRINVFHIDLPPLRSRAGDVLLYAQEFVEQYASSIGKAVTGLSPNAAEKLLAYAWPGNIRELQNAMERAVAFTSHEQITVEDLPEQVRNYRTSHVLLASDDPAELVTLEEVERRYIAKVLDVAGGNKTLAAQILGVDRRTLYRKFDPSAGSGRAAGHRSRSDLKLT